MKLLIKHLQTSLANTFDNDELLSAIRTICCDILGFGSTAYYLKEPVALTTTQEAQLSNIINRLQQGEPLQYIEGETQFYGIKFYVNPAVLIPRPETTELVDWIIRDNPNKPIRILDLGTGSGCIAIALSRQLPQATIDACDISSEALAMAKKNNESNDTQVTFFIHDMLNTTTPLPHSYDILVSNPPYIRQSEAKEMARNVTEWEPHTALFVPDNDALRFYHAIAEIGQTEALRPGGSIYVEINQALGKETVNLFETYGYQEVTLRKDIYGNERMVRVIKN